MPSSALAGSLFWTTAEPDASEFVAEDPLALDYLAQQVGNALLPGFTTRTSRANSYAVVLYGLLATERCLDAHRLPPGERTAEETFERFERIWAMAVTHHFGGPPPPGERMRGVRGAEKTYAASNPERLPIDYRLISRQLELGSLGAYLTSCRHHGLVRVGGLGLQPAGREVAEALFTEASDTRMHGQYDEFIDQAMEPGRRNLPTKVGKLTLERIGEMSRLGRIRERPELSALLHRILFDGSPDKSTQELAGLLAHEGSGGRATPERFFPALASGELSASPGLQRLAQLASRYGETATALRLAFDELFSRVVELGWRTGVDAALSGWLPGDGFARLQAGCRELLATEATTLFGKLQVHGPGFLQLLRRLVEADRPAAVAALLSFHGAVQAARSHGRGWMRVEGGDLAIDVPAYDPARVDEGRWLHDFKLNAVRSLLADLGRFS